VVSLVPRLYPVASYLVIGEIVRVHGEEGPQAASHQCVDCAEHVGGRQVENEIDAGGEAGVALDHYREIAHDDETDV
jgi:hypothetical protein